MSRGHNNPYTDATRATGPHPDWSAVEWWVYRTPAVGGGYSYRVAARKLSAGELRPAEELACTVSRCSLAQVRGLLARGAEPGEVQAVVDAVDEVRVRNREAADAPHRARMAERRAKAQAAFEARRRKAEQRLAEDVARAAPAEAA